MKSLWAWLTTNNAGSVSMFESISENAQHHCGGKKQSHGDLVHKLAVDFKISLV